MDCELLINAPASTIFSLYQDPYHWNILFSGINQAYFDKQLAPEAKGVIETASAGRWRMRVTQVFDDHKLVIRFRKGVALLYFRLEIHPVSAHTCRVNHTMTSNFIGASILFLFRKQIHEWLRLNLLIVQRRAQKMVAEGAAGKPRKKRKPTKNKTK